MHRKPLLDLIDQYLVRHPAEGDNALRFRDFVVRNPQCFERSLAEGHITASAWILDATGQKTLLTHHRKLNLWLQPGGHADGNSDVLAVALQEGLEETGLRSLRAVSPEIFDLDIHGIPARKEEPSHFHYDVRFLLQNDGAETFVVSAESHDLAWVELDQLETYTTEWSMRRMRDKAKEQQG
ncbi:MAG TPA: NUDIX hydrolase [Verrucomicrobiales bacterium]|jgi:8-oxo-dGTP pyrophosphatase MutT (NUDIX family)|nr:NUDIX hydrolase [Verrucomicrobiales bacterium]